MKPTQGKTCKKWRGYSESSKLGGCSGKKGLKNK